MAQFWKIEEAVTGRYYIVLPGIYTTKTEAEAAISTMRSNQNMRAVLYQTGSYHGPERVDV